MLLTHILDAARTRAPVASVATIYVRGSDDLPALAPEADELDDAFYDELERHAVAMRDQQAKERTVGAPKTREELQAWLFEATGWKLPAEPVCRDHDAPLDFVWDVFSGRVSDALVLANRGGGKTLAFALLHLCNARWKAGHETSHFGAIERQAKRAYGYYQAAAKKPGLKGQLPLQPALTGTTWRNGSKIEILPATEAQSQGGHPNLVCLDEIESCRPQPYRNTKAMPMERALADGTIEPGQYIAGSTRMDARGMMQAALDEAAEGDSLVELYSWCIFDTMAPCEVPKDSPLWEWLPEEGLTKAAGWRSYDDVMKHFRRVDRDTWLAQYLNKKPNPASLIYPMFDNVTDDAEYVPGGGPIYIWYDAGFTDNSAFLFVQERERSKERPYLHYNQFDEIVGKGKAERSWIRECVKRVMLLPDYDGPSWETWMQIWQGKALWPDPWPTVWPEAAGDPSAAVMGFEFKEHGIGAQTAKMIGHKVVDGQDVLRAAILTADNRRSYFVHSRCIETFKSFDNLRARELPDGSYSREPDPAAANHVWSHTCDAARYGIFPQRRRLGLTPYLDTKEEGAA